MCLLFSSSILLGSLPTLYLRLESFGPPSIPLRLFAHISIVTYSWVSIHLFLLFFKDVIGRTMQRRDVLLLANHVGVSFGTGYHFARNRSEEMSLCFQVCLHEKWNENNKFSSENRVDVFHLCSSRNTVTLLYNIVLYWAQFKYFRTFFHFISVFTRNHHWTCPKPVESTPHSYILRIEDPF
jgi:hypothetical protein